MDDASNDVETVTDFRRVSLLGSTDGGSDTDGNDTEGGGEGGGDNDDKGDTPVLGSVGGLKVF